MITDYSHITQMAKSKGELMQTSFFSELPNESFIILSGHVPKHATKYM